MKTKELSNKELLIIKQGTLLVDISILRRCDSRAITTEYKKQLYAILEAYQKESIKVDEQLKLID